MAFQELKEKGNKCFSNNDYTGAIEFYTKAMDICPTEHTLFSNRSISYSKLGKFVEALMDANKCIELKPNFARGYLRKCVALNGLGRYEEVLVPAQDGYKLRGSDAICEGCVREWVSANEAFFKVKILEMPEEIPPLIPAQCQIVSDDYLTILLNLIVARLNHTTTIIPLNSTIAYLFKIFQELERLLKLFDHKPPPTVDEWVDAFFNASKLDPTSSKVHPSNISMLFKTSEELATYLTNDVDHILYPIISPVIFLMILTVNIRCISLNCVNTDHHVVEVTAGSCLVFFEKSLLSSPKYTDLHIGVYKELLEGISHSSSILTVNEISLYKKYIQNLESLLKNPNIDREVFEKAMVSIGLIKIRLGENPGFDHVSYGTGHGKLISRKGREEILHYVDVMVEIIQDFLKIPLGDPLPYTALQDSESLIYCTSGLVRHGEYSKAVEVFKLCEEAFVRILQRQIFNQSFNLDSGPKVLWSLQSMIFTNANAFLAVDQIKYQPLVATTVVKWHCIFSEFRALIMRLGMATRYMDTFKMIQKMNTEKNCDLTVSKLADIHQHEVKRIMRVKGMVLLTGLLKQDHKMIQDSLKDGEIVMEYCTWVSTYVYHDSETSSNEDKNDGFLLLLRKDGIPVVKLIDFKAVTAVAQDWLKTNKKSSGEIEKVTKFLCNVLIPADVQGEISSSAIKRIYLSLDPRFSVLPFELLPLPCGELIGKKCLLVYLSTAREKIRSQTLEGSKKILSIIEAHKPSTEESAADDQDSEKGEKCIDVDNLTIPKSTANSGSCSKQQFIIVADPDYNLEQNSVNDADVIAMLSEAISGFFLKPSTQACIASPLPKTKNEAQEVEYVVASSQNPVPVECISGKKATLSQVLQVESPFVLHFATHGFAKQTLTGSTTFWDDTKCGLLLAGANTFSKGDTTKLVPEAGTGQLSGLAVMGMNLQNTRLVYLSLCISAQGSFILGESINSLAHAFRAAGVQTVIATLWTVFDDEARMFAVHFYYEAFKTGVTPSEALKTAKEKMSESGYHWVYWSSFICIGEDLPLF